MRIALILLLIVFSLGLVSAACSDSDGGKNKYEFGGVTYNGETYSDTCVDNNIKEYFCSADQVASFTTLECINGCEEGSCILTSTTPVSFAPEDEEETSYRTQLLIFFIVLLIGLFAYWFKIKRKRR
jgi:hypothetical protein